MAPILRFAFRHLCFWLLFFAFFRLVSLIIGWNQILEIPALETLGVFWHGLRIDISAASYLFAIPLVCIPFLSCNWNQYTSAVIRNYERLMVLVCTITFAASAVIFKFWGTLLNVRALEFAMYPNQMLASVSGAQLLMILVGLMVT